MAYLGPPPSQKLATPTSQYFSGNGSATAFTLNRPVNVAEDLNVFVNNVAQQPGSGKSYTATGTTLTFDAAPDAGTNNVYVVYRGLAEPTTRLEHPSGQPLAATTGTFSGNVSIGGNLSVTGTDPSIIKHMQFATISGDTGASTTSTSFVATPVTITVAAADVAKCTRLVISHTGSTRTDKNTHAFQERQFQRTAPSAVTFQNYFLGTVAGGSESLNNVTMTIVDASLGTGDHTYTVYVRKASGNAAYAANVYTHYTASTIVVWGF